jgi:UDP-N-acetylglucosamine 4-epimerase
MSVVNERSRGWLVTGAAGFIGSHLLEHLLARGDRVVAVDNFSTGSRSNLEEVEVRVGPDPWRRLEFIEGDLRDLATCRRACDDVEFVLHQAALGSVPRSIDDPLATHESNVTGTLNLLVAAREAGVRRFVYASSSAVYGDAPELPKVEEHAGRPLSPYAVSKVADELYARVFDSLGFLETIGLRYFNVFGPRQDPDGPYAAVIPRWIGELLARQPAEIYGDGMTSRDFCYVDNVVQANLRAAATDHGAAVGEVYNIAVGDRTMLLELFTAIRDRLARRFPELADAEPVYRDFRTGDVRHSLADISKAERLLGYVPTHDLERGLDESIDWYVEALRPASGQAPRHA